MRVLAITPLFPNPLEPRFGTFNRQQFAALARMDDVDLRVLCTIPYVPGAHRVGIPKRAARLSELPRDYEVEGIPVRAMRRYYVPSVGTPVALPLFLGSLLPHRDLFRWADIVLATWAFPDGCASLLAAHAEGKACVVKVHGSDVNVIAKTRTARPQVRALLPRAEAIATVSRAMGEDLISEGVRPERVHLVPNGINPGIFYPRDKQSVRRELGLPTEGRILTFVGRLENEKGIVELLSAFDRLASSLTDATLVLVGEVVHKERVNEALTRHGSRVVTTGPLPLEQVAAHLAACDVFTLPSYREGTPNVVLEALASGRPVVATRVGGIPDVMTHPDSGFLVPPQEVDSLSEALRNALEKSWDADKVLATGPVPWTESARVLHGVLAGARNMRLSRA